MVLKKSNSPFNSGATQKGITRGAYLNVNEPSESLLSFTLRNLPALYDEQNPSEEHAKALEKIYDYLGFSGPGLKQFHEADNIFHWDMTSKSLSISLNNQELWLIPGRINDLMKENDFLDGEENCAEIRVRKVKKIAGRSKIYKTESCVLNPKIEIGVGNVYRRKNRRGIGKNRRGVQRPHLLTPPAREENADEENRQAQRPKKAVEVELQEEDQVDARVLKGCTDERNYRQKRQTKSKSKLKSCVNGKNSYQFRAYNPPQLRTEIQGLLNYDNVWMEDYYIPRDDDAEMIGGEDCEEYCYNNDYNLEENYHFSITSFESPRPKRKHKRCQQEQNLNPNEVQIVNVNTASSQTTVKHPKGSFQVIKTPPVINKDMKGTDSSGNDSKNVSRDENHVELNFDPTVSTDICTQKIEIPLASSTFQNQDDFSSVDLRIPKGVQEMMMESLLQSHSQSVNVDGYSISLGNCFPPVICVSLDQCNNTGENGWNLIGISHSNDMLCNKDLKWEVTLKNAKLFSMHGIVKDAFSHNLDLKKNCTVSIHDLIQMARNSIQTESMSWKKAKLSTKKENLFYLNSNASSAEVFTMEEAVKRLHAERVKKSQKLETSVTNSHLEIPSESIECDICFNLCNKHGQKDTGIVTLLPCNHSFCYQCWLSHIFFHTTSGNTEISCMHTDCKELINETALTSFIPENYMAKFYSLRQERCIETSPLCQWCPKSTCNKVAMIAEESLHLQQFGSCVVCDCKKSFCFSCQANPHWPLSCEQAAAYRKLLYKLGDYIPAAADVSYDIDLKPCPGCRYPIEKNEGCPHMKCRMCGFNFCWKCLQSTATHRVWECSMDEKSTFVTYQLFNGVVNNFPLKYFDRSLEMKQRLKFMRKLNFQAWINGLKSVECTKIKLSFERSVHMEKAMLIKSRAISLATESVSFVKDSYSFLEYFYTLVSFALLNKEKKDSKVFQLCTNHVIDGLAFTASRLENVVIGKSLRQLISSEATAQMYLSIGREMLEKLKRRVTSLQKRSRNVPAQPIGELDPKQYYRYK